MLTRLGIMKWWFYQRWTMATSDVFVLKSIYDMTTGNGSMIVSVGEICKYSGDCYYSGILTPGFK
jgi:hypothetical protein